MLDAAQPYETPVRGLRRKDCWFYHTIDLPGDGTIEGIWDLRNNAGEYLGGVDFKDQRVLEIGPASGFLTAWMDKQGAEVVAVEQPSSVVWDFVPLDTRNDDWRNIEAMKVNNNRQLKNSYWYTHEKLGLSAKTLYRRVDDLPEGIEDFDIAVLAMVLTHMRDPAKAIEICARKASKKLVITDRLYVPEHLQDFPVMWYVPQAGVKRYDTWWYFARGYFKTLLTGIGFSRVDFKEVVCTVKGGTAKATAIVAEW